MSVPRFRSYRCRNSLVNVVSPNQIRIMVIKESIIRKLTNNSELRI